jgi:DUF3015 family protein
MKKELLFAALLMTCSPIAAHAAAGTMESGPGCGLGAMLWADSASKKHILQQSMIASTNATGMQTFAITSGTSGCTNDGVIVQNERVNVFAGINFDSLTQEMAQGSGEHLSSLATLMGVPVEMQPQFFALVQQHYDAILQPQNATPVTMLNSLYETMASDPAFAQLAAKG